MQVGNNDKITELTMKQFYVNICAVVALYPERFEEINESFVFNDALTAANFAEGYAKSMSWVIGLKSHENRCFYGYRWWDYENKDVIRVETESGDVVNYTHFAK